ncbi:hydroxyethylthiazole kinase [Methanosphaera sp. WGK6]|uniref:hydroxyethylthiazole kinase n=1 Tax=Methanosphaera sp. WGK6 TaxID=1561964 RepID=UPI00084BE19A|nr:hydroxyethylthiazole kinase [Methanosphaera sp. WGK6]OED29840.1 hydroxyethylthiazole kinase [Methanosphaera sp. WGK6]
MKETIIEKTIETMEQLRTNSPLTHCITNVVTVTDCANAVLAVGGSPIMANAPEEAEEITGISNSLLINVGTPTSEQVTTMIKSAKKVKETNKPYVLDPVGVGISKIRNETPITLIKEAKPAIIRGNLSEIKAIAMFFNILDECTKAKGVDVAESDKINEDTLESQGELIKNIAKKLDTTIAVSGPIDIISDGNEVYVIENGDAMMSNITGTGCMLGCILAAYAAITEPLIAAITGTVVMGIAGEIAAQTTINNKQGTGSFGTYLIDELSLMNDKTLFEKANIRKL